MLPFQLFTSIKPPTNVGEIVYLSDCLNSWRAAGFSAVAVNGPKETEALLQLDLGIEFAPLPSDGKPSIGAIFSAIRASGVRFAGIINSDCKIVRYPNLATNLLAGLDRTVVLAWRIDLGSDLQPTTRRGGFDAFFFDANIIPPDDSGFSIAEPWWDYWFPLACEMNGARLETLTLPLLTHKDHPENWSEQNFVSAGHRFWGMLQNWHRRGDLPKSLIARVPAGLQFDHTPSKEQLLHLAGVPPFWLFDCRPQTIDVMGPEAADVETILRFGGHLLYNEVLRQCNEVLRQSSEAELAQIRNSTCWRMTAPLRKVVIAVRKITAVSRTRWVQFRRWFRPRTRTLAFVRAVLPSIMPGRRPAS
jgi:hypothetical protein